MQRLGAPGEDFVIGTNPMLISTFDSDRGCSMMFEIMNVAEGQRMRDNLYHLSPSCQKGK